MELDRMIGECLKGQDKALGPATNSWVVKGHKELEPSNFVSPITF